MADKKPMKIPSIWREKFYNQNHPSYHSKGFRDMRARLAKVHGGKPFFDEFLTKVGVAPEGLSKAKAGAAPKVDKATLEKRKRESLAAVGGSEEGGTGKTFVTKGLGAGKPKVYSDAEKQQYASERGIEVAKQDDKSKRLTAIAAAARRRREQQALKPSAKAMKELDKVDEEVEQIDEISKETASNYAYAAIQKQIKKKGLKGALQDKTSKRAVGIDRALDRLTKEEVEQGLEEGKMTKYELAREKLHKDNYKKHMTAHMKYANKGDWDRAELHAQEAEKAAEEHYNETGKKIKDAGYSGNSPHIVNEATKGYKDPITGQVTQIPAHKAPTYGFNKFGQFASLDRAPKPRKKLHNTAHHLMRTVDEFEEGTPERQAVTDALKKVVGAIKEEKVEEAHIDPNFVATFGVAAAAYDHVLNPLLKKAKQKIADKMAEKLAKKKEAPAEQVAEASLAADIQRDVDARNKRLADAATKAKKKKAAEAKAASAAKQTKEMENLKNLSKYGSDEEKEYAKGELQRIRGLEESEHSQYLNSKITEARQQILNKLADKMGKK